MADGRNLRYDNAKGILIILVVVGHFLLPIKGHTRVCSNIFFLIYTFHMAAFTFISGLFSRGIYREIQGRKRFNWSRWFRTLVLYIVFEIITFFSEIPAYGKTSDFPNFLKDTGAPWYLFALLIWYLFIPFLSLFKDKYIRIGSDKKYRRNNIIYRKKALKIPCSLHLWICITILSLAGGYFQVFEKYLELDRVISFAPFFFAGYFLGQEKLEKYFDYRKVFSVFSSLNLLITAASVIAVGFFMFDYLWDYRYVVYGSWYEKVSPLGIDGRLYMGSLSTEWIVRLVWYIMAGNMTFTFLRFMPTGYIPFITKTGQRTLQIYILHRPIRDLILAAGYITCVDPSNLSQLSILIVCSVLLTVVLSAKIFAFPFSTLLYIVESCIASGAKSKSKSKYKFGSKGKDKSLRDGG